MLARHVTHVFQDMDRTLEDLERLKGLHSGSVRLLTAESVNADLLPGAIAVFHGRHPHVQLHARTAGSQTIPQAISDGEADIGLAFALYRHPDLRQVAVGRFPLGAVMAPAHRLAGRKSLALGALLPERLFLATPDLAIRQLMEPHLARAAREFRPAGELSSIELARQLALRGQGIVFMTRFGIEAELARKALVFVPLNLNGPIVSNLGIYVRRGRALPPAVDALVQVLTEAVDGREKDG